MNNCFNSLILTNNYIIELYSNNKKINNNNNIYKIPNTPINIKLYNNNSSRCDVHIYSNNLIGIYRINPHNSILISDKNFKKNTTIKFLFKPEAGSCGYGCIQEYDKYCTTNNSTLNTGPKGEVNIKSNDLCKFGPDYINQLDDWTKQYQLSKGNLHKVINSESKIVASLNDIDYSRISKFVIELV